MSQQKKLSLCATLVLFSALACRLLQSPGITPAPLSSSTSTSTPRAPALTSTLTLVPVLSPTITSTPPAETSGPFRNVALLPDLLAESTEEIQVRPLADGTVWIITRQAVMRWDGQSWETVLSEDEDFLAAVDDGGRLWVLRQDRSEIAAWQTGQWSTYAADSGWTEAYITEPSWWAPSPWSATSGATGTLWLPMSRDVRSFDGEGWSLYALEDMGFPPPDWEDLDVIHRLAMRAGEVWVGECYYSGPGPMGGQGVRWFDGRAWHGADAPVGATCVSAIGVDPAGDVWLGAIDAIWRYAPASQAWTPFRFPQALLADYNFAQARQLIVDGNGDAWVIMLLCGGASCGGSRRLYRIHDGEWSLVIDSQDWSLPLEQLTLDGSRQGWLFWDGTVFRLEGESIQTVVSMAARGVGVSPGGDVWVVADSEGGAALWILEP